MARVMAAMATPCAAASFNDCVRVFLEVYNWRCKKKSTGFIIDDGIKEHNWSKYEPTIAQRVESLFRLGYIQKKAGGGLKAGDRKNRIVSQLKRIKKIRIDLQIQRDKELRQAQEYNDKLYRSVKKSNKSLLGMLTKNRVR